MAARKKVAKKKKHTNLNHKSRIAKKKKAIKRSNKRLNK